MRTVQFPENADCDDTKTGAPHWDDLSRQVYCLLGIPIDAIDMPALVRIVEEAAMNGAPFLISTANLNFLVSSRRDPEFRETLWDSELCTADGMIVVWLARLMGLPIKTRVAGSDMLRALKTRCSAVRRLKLVLFGGVAGVAEAAAKVLNASPGELMCVGAIDPGFGSVDELSQDHIIERVNASGADFLVASLGARKGQLWLQRNACRLRVPIRAHLGATLGFEAGNIKRAPPLIRHAGLEWLWRIKEEPRLWKRYRNDGVTLLRLLLTHVLPLAVRARWQGLWGGGRTDLAIERTQDQDTVTLHLFGAGTRRNVEQAIPVFKDAVATKKRITINLSNTRGIDARFLGLLLMLRKRARRQGAEVALTGASPRLTRTFRLNGVGFLLG